MIRVHYGKVGTLVDIAQHDAPSRKPTGLWWAFGTEWHDYVSNRKPRGAYLEGPRYAVELLQGANLLILESMDDLHAFTQKYGRRLPFARPDSPADRCVDWAKNWQIRHACWHHLLE